MKQESPQIYYKQGYKYQLTRRAFFRTGIRGYCVNTEYITLYASGLLYIKTGYAWDGPSGPTIDTPDSMRASLPHDACYQLMRLGLIPESCRIIADKELRQRLLADGMDEIRAAAWYEGVHLFAGAAASAAAIKKELTAP